MPNPPTWHRRRPPGAVKDCITCIHWTAGTIVLRGNTQGHCSNHGTREGADAWCSEHTEAAS